MADIKIKGAYHSKIRTRNNARPLSVLIQSQAGPTRVGLMQLNTILFLKVIILVYFGDLIWGEMWEGGACSWLETFLNKRFGVFHPQSWREEVNFPFIIGLKLPYMAWVRSCSKPCKRNSKIRSLAMTNAAGRSKSWTTSDVVAKQQQTQQQQLNLQEEKEEKMKRHVCVRKMCVREALCMLLSCTYKHCVSLFYCRERCWPILAVAQQTTISYIIYMCICDMLPITDWIPRIILSSGAGLCIGPCPSSRLYLGTMIIIFMTKMYRNGIFVPVDGHCYSYRMRLNVLGLQ